MNARQWNENRSTPPQWYAPPPVLPGYGPSEFRLSGVRGNNGTPGPPPGPVGPITAQPGAQGAPPGMSPPTTPPVVPQPNAPRQMAPPRQSDGAHSGGWQIPPREPPREQPHEQAPREQHPRSEQAPRESAPREQSQRETEQAAPESVLRNIPRTAAFAQGKRFESEESSNAELVRPYFRTKGRTRPIVELSLESLISTSDKGMNSEDLFVPEHRSICDLCKDTRSVAEVAAFLRLPLGVARVLIADVASLGLVFVHTSSHMVGDRPSIDFMERVLSGLRTV